MNKCKIWIPRGKRSNWGLIDPIIKKIENNPFFELCHFAQFPDIAFITGDRIEMLENAQVCFNVNTPICHFYAGILNSFATKDDIYRHQITLMSEIQLCESYHAYLNVLSLCNSINKEPDAHIVGITHLEDVELAFDYVPTLPFDLVLYNPVSDKKQQKEDLKQITELIRKRGNYITIGNPDEIIFQESHSHTHYNNLDRAQFLGLLSKCERFISNSSIVYYEAPFLMKTGSELIQIGNRNNERSTKDDKLDIIGTSNRIIMILKEWWTKKNE